MELGASLAEGILARYQQLELPHHDLLAFTVPGILRIIGEHDNSKVPLLEPDLTKHRSWLLRAGEPKDWLMQLHWEADALWMLHRDGLRIDLARTAKVPLKEFIGSSGDTDAGAIAQFAYNFHLHRRIVELYQRAYPQKEDFAAFGFPHQGYLYRSASGQRIAEEARNNIVEIGNAFMDSFPAVVPGSSKLDRLVHLAIHGDTGDAGAALALLGLGCGGSVPDVTWDLLAKEISAANRIHLDAARYNHNLSNL
jgi:hypothetical protein